MTQPTGRGLVAGFAPVFLGEADNAAARANSSTEAPTVAGAAAAAILLATAAIEASLSEAATILADPRQRTPPLPTELLATVRDGNDPLHTRYQRLLEHFERGLTLEREEAFIALRCLVELRNTVAHRAAAFLEAGRLPERLQPCNRRIPLANGPDADWTSRVFVPQVATWAVTTAREWLAFARRHTPLAAV